MSMTTRQMEIFDAKINKIYFGAWKATKTSIGGQSFFIAKNEKKAKRKAKAWLKVRAPNAEFEVFKEYIPF